MPEVLNPPVSEATRRQALPMQQRSARLQPQTWNEERGAVTVSWGNGVRVRRYDYWNDKPYEEELVMSTDAVDMQRFDAGAVQVLDGHDRHSGVSAILGIADRGWIENGEGMAEIRLSRRPELAGVVADIQAGIIRDISVGYSVQRYEITRAQDRTDGGNVDLWRAVRWMPHEISFVAVPADPSAGTRSAAGPRPQAQVSQAQFDCEFHSRANAQSLEIVMPEGNIGAAAPEDTTRAAAPAAAGTTQSAPVDDGVTRAADIADLCQRSGVPELAAGMIRGSVSLEAAQRAVADEMARRDAAAGGHVNVRGSVRNGGQDETRTRLQGIEEALQHRCDPRAAITDNGRQYRGMSLLEIGRDWLEHRGVNTRGMDRLRLSQLMLSHRSLDLNERSAGMHTTSDFASLLANVANKRLRSAYEENPGTYTRWARRGPNLPDFKETTVAQMGAMPELLRVNEAGEIKYGTIGDGSEKYALLTYGRIVSLTRQAIINDDLRAFDRVNTGFGAAAARLENRTVYAQLTANANMSDGFGLFSSQHANNATGAPSVLSFTSLVSMRTAMRVQKGLAGEELNLVPAWLIVPAALEQTAYQFTSSQYVPATQGNTSEFRAGGRTSLEPVVEPILDGSGANSATTWFAAARNSQVDTVEYAYLDGAEGPVLESEVGFEVDGVSFKARLDFAAKTLDWRGLYRAVGA